MNDKTKAYAAAISYSLTIGFSFLCIKICLQHASSADILAHRFLIAGALALVVLLCKRGGLSLSKKDLVQVFGLSLFYPLLFFLLQTVSLEYIQTVEAGIIQATTPIFTLIFAFFILKERITLKTGSFALISVAGVMFIMLMNGASPGAFNPLGTALIFGATISMALYLSFARKLTRRLSVFQMTTVMSFTGCVVFLIFAFAQRGYTGVTTNFFEPFTHPMYVLAIVFLGTASSYLSSFLSNYTLSKLQAAKMSVFSNLATVVALFVGAVLLGEGFHWYHALGSALVIAGVLGMNMSLPKRRKKTKTTSS